MSCIFAFLKYENRKMSQIINPFEKIPPRFIIKDTIDILYKFGLSSHRKLKRESKLHKCLRYILPLFYAINSLKSLNILREMSTQRYYECNARIGYKNNNICIHTSLYIPEINWLYLIFYIYIYIMRIYISYENIKI